MKTEGGQTILYINKYYEINLDTEEETSYYYLGDRLAAMSENGTLKYLHQDHLSGTSIMTDTNANQVETTMKYYPYGETRVGSVPTDKLFTGQRLDDTGLYYYGARYYDASMGRFISPDTIVPSPANPQSFNRYSYCLNNPLKYVDPNGHIVEIQRQNSWLAYLMYCYGNANIGPYAMMMVTDMPDPQLYAAYEAVRDTAPVETGIIETSDKVYTIGWESLGWQIDSTIDFDTGEISINSDLIQADSFYVSKSMLDQVYNAADNFGIIPKYSNVDVLVAYDIAAFTGDLTSIIALPTVNPVASVVGQWTSAVANMNAFVETFYRYKTGRANGLDLTVSGITTVTGFVPYFGVIPAGFQWWWDTRD